ncbi:MAG: DedA family protein [Rubritepida sp.]|nr:DedA family protein [Rubritepida sp.]
MPFLHASAAHIEAYLAAYGLFAIFGLIYLESLGLPVPGESALIGASVLAIHGEFSVFSLLAVVWAAAVLGDSTGYLIGRVGGRPLLRRYGWLVRLTPERLARLKELFRRRGALIIVGARFVVLLRQLNGLVAGSMGMPWPHFVAANALGGALWAAAWTLGPYYLGGFFGLNSVLHRP